ncbi:hypothetical protein PLESTB_001684000 [Pleodorina starrii]|uniref:Uncharacterized protein n=1 Tax=Pleodorina starrii TaxID=330485 RepID=A0A9W6BYZ7_9CHLO|nr:hypothetical protein PLESTB_001684000 [Pleodorina starrii]GLC66695.1 hypothetical protein PLESTF_000462000 [Pleodorina starrii]
MLRTYFQSCNFAHRANKRPAAVLRMAAASQPSGAGACSFKGSMDRYAALEGLRRESPAAERNKQPILDVLLEYLPRRTGTAAAAPDAAPGDGARRPLILEIASGSGQHAAHVAAGLPEYDIQPTDVTPELYGSIAAYAADLPNVRLPPLALDAAAADDWPRAVAAASAGDGDGGNVGAGARGCVDAILCVNMCHISPLAATRGLLRGAGVALRPAGGLLFVYGPFTRGGRHTSDSNAAFDASLRNRDLEWGYRDLDQMAAWAAEAGLDAVEVRDMPANNFMLVFRRGGRGGGEAAE